MGSALASIAVLVTAGIAWLYHRHISALRATLNFVTLTEIGDPSWRENRAVFLRLTSGDGSNLLGLTEPDENQIEKVTKVSRHLDHCEFVAVAIRKRAMHEKTYKLWQRTSYVDTWVKAQPYIVELRRKRNHETMYENFERLAEKWK